MATKATRKSSGKSDSSPNDTPMMRQFNAAKERYPRHLLFFRMGDFFELFHEDAKVVARVLGLTLTSRSKGPDSIPMAGVPANSAEQYISRLLRQGFSVAVCDQTEDASQAKGLVKREVTRVVTPGTVVEDDLLEANRPNRLVAVYPDPDQAGFPINEKTYGLASVDLSGGIIFVQELLGQAGLLSELARLQPSECLLPESDPLPPGAKPVPILPAGTEGRFSITPLNKSAFEAREAQGRLTARFGKVRAEETALKKQARAMPLAMGAAGALLGYVEETHPGGIHHLQAPQNIDPEEYLLIDETAIRSLELVETIRDRNFEGSLLWTIDRTRTGPGARCLREWLLRPLRKIEPLRDRQDAVGMMVNDPELRGELRFFLKEVADLERIAARLSTGRATPRDLIALKNTLRTLPKFENSLAGLTNGVLAECRTFLGGLDTVADRIERTIQDDCPNNIADGGLIREGVDAELDRLRDVASGGKQWIANFQAMEAERANIPGLKIGFNRVFGYYLEVSKSNASKVPEEWERRQTLTHAERFVTPELKDHEAEVLGAEDKIRALEVKLFQALRDEVAEAVPGLQAAGRSLAVLDAIASLGEVAARKRHVRPGLSNGGRLIFEQLRHPVLEETLPKGELVPNDLALDAKGGSNAKRSKTGKDAPPQILLLTGPNMAGKSTYIRAAALGTILAQMGAFVPAERAEVGLADRVFTRVGAADDLFGGRSTFMVEMIEVAQIMAQATDRSMVVLDEVGRGTSTYDGVSLAWALVEFIHNGPSKPRTLFATHYHELCALDAELPGVKNASAVVKEWQGEITFLYRIVAGHSEHSFGLHVARLAGVPSEVIERARSILFELEAEAQERLTNVASTGAGRSNAKGGKINRHLAPTEEDGQLLLFEPSEIQIDPSVKSLLDDIRSMDPTNLTPMESMAMLDKLVKKARGLA